MVVLYGLVRRIWRARILDMVLLFSCVDKCGFTV